jgi:DNA-binding beta-propeller fold protein YncE
MGDTPGQRYAVVEGWEQLPPGVTHLDCVGVDTDADDNVFILTRDQNQVLVYDRDGRFTRAWGAALFASGRPHGLRIGPDGRVYLVDDGAHCVFVTTPTGELLQTIGIPGAPSATGYDGRNLASITGGPPFNAPTNLAVGPTGDLYVSDGYGNCKVHRFTADGVLVQSWGEPGTGPGQFNLPHGIAVTADGRVLVADRENDRVQVFDAAGRHLATWADVQRPTNVDIDAAGRIYVSELWRRVGQPSYVHGETTTDRPGRVSVLAADGGVLARFGASSEARAAAGNFVAPHDVCVDSRGDLYVAEVTQTFGVKGGGVPAGTHSFQKFARVG